ncbi:MAG: SH3 domain-containing protein [Candidatus Latescibacterota bacterium]
MKRSFVPVLICGFMTLLSSIASGERGMSEAPVLSETLYNRAPDVLEGTLPEMRTASYWISKMQNPDEIILPLDRIMAMNERFEKKMGVPDPFDGINPERKEILYPLDARKKPLERPGRLLSVPDPHRMTQAEIFSAIRETICRETAYLRSMQFGNMYAVVYSPEEIDAFEREMALGRIPEKIEILDGITVRHSRIRIVPSQYPLQVGLKENKTIRNWDMWNLGILRIGRPVSVLHISNSGSFFFVLSDEGYGWVNAEDIAFGSRAAIEKYTEPANFAVCTGDRVPYYTDEKCRFISGWLRMGDRVPLARKSSARAILVPLRITSGRFEAETAWLAKDSDTHAGYLPYTRRNTVETAFKLLDNPYDWTGAWMGRSHETTYRDIFACFGFRLPCQGELFTHFGTCEEVLPVAMSKEEKHRRILAHEPFVTLQVSWEHAQLLLGGYNGMPIVFDNHGYDYTGPDGKLFEIKRTCVGDTRQPWYFYDHPVTFLELK